MIKGYKYDRTSQKYKQYKEKRKKKLEQNTWDRLDNLNKKKPIR